MNDFKIILALISLLFSIVKIGIIINCIGIGYILWTLGVHNITLYK